MNLVGIAKIPKSAKEIVKINGVVALYRAKRRILHKTNQNQKQYKKNVIAKLKQREQT